VAGTTVVVHYGFTVESIQRDIGWLRHKSILIPILLIERMNYRWFDKPVLS